MKIHVWLHQPKFSTLIGTYSLWRFLRVWVVLCLRYGYSLRWRICNYS